MFDSGEAELPKMYVHLGLFGLATLCLGYNAIAYSQRPKDKHLLYNALFYTLLDAVEVVQIVRHAKEL